MENLIAEQQVEKPIKKPPKKASGAFYLLYFPWLSLLASILSIILLLQISHADFMQGYIFWQQSWQQHHWIKFLQNSPAILLAGLMIIYIIDGYFFFSRKRKLKKVHQQLNQQLTDALQSKKQHQQRANTYSSHTDRLKSFISDKLLEYIEYDEKFVHFKGIAAEIRHNGVISYDKVLTALNKAIEQQQFIAAYEEKSSESGEASQDTLEALAKYQTAIEAMRYLWALLDLSTAENMSLHIGNQLIECEENYYQQQLDAENNQLETYESPLATTFYPQYAALTTLSLLFDAPKISHLISLAKINEAVLDNDFNYENELFRVQLKPVAQLLGNHNHIILLLENLIKNAQFFIQKKRYKQKSDRIFLSLYASQDYAHFVVYNRGPKIPQEEIENVFKLGFSTRKSKHEHGKGLGLFFVQQIIKGYRGEITATNVANPSIEYVIRLNLINETSLEYRVASNEIDHRVKVTEIFEKFQQEDSEKEYQWQNEITFETEIRLHSIEVKALTNNQQEQTNHQYVLDEGVKVNQWLDPQNSMHAHWRIEIKNARKGNKITFTPLDVGGVRFDAKLPTIEALLPV